MKLWFSILCSLVLLQSCSDSPKAELWFSTDFENLAVFGRSSNSLSSSRSQSGMYSTFVDENMEFAYGSEFTVKSITKKTPKEAVVSAKIYSGAPSPDGLIVIEIRRPGEEKPLFWHGLTLKDKVTAPGQWMDVEEKFNLPDNLQPDDNFKIYMWRNAAKAPIFMDDLGIGFNLKK